MYQLRNVKPFFREGKWSGPRPRLIRRHPKFGYSLSDAIELTSRDAYLIDGSKPNRAVYSSVSSASIGSIAGDWRGPIVVLLAQGISIDPDTYKDISLNDFRRIMDYFVAFTD
jgi:hypothetical protein